MNKSMMAMIGVFLLVLQGCATESDLKKQGVVAMTSSEMKEKLTGNSLVGTSRGGYDVTWFLRENGTLAGVNHGGGSDSGVWEITQDGSFCTQWTRWGTTKGCFKLYIVGDKMAMCRVDGDCGGSFKIVQGNPDKL